MTTRTAVTLHGKTIGHITREVRFDGGPCYVYYAFIGAHKIDDFYRTAAEATAAVTTTHQRIAAL